MRRLESISAEVAQKLRDALYFTIRTRVVRDKKVYDQSLLDQRARDIVSELIEHLDRFDIRLVTDRAPQHSDSGHYAPDVMDADERARHAVAAAGRPDLLPILNSRPMLRDAEDV